jgi:hypothetical protein
MKTYSCHQNGSQRLRELASKGKLPNEFRTEGALTVGRIRVYAPSALSPSRPLAVNVRLYERKSKYKNIKTSIEDAIKSPGAIIFVPFSSVMSHSNFTVIAGLWDGP